MLETQARACLSTPHPKCALVFADARTSKPHDEEMLTDRYFVLIEREARSHPDLTPVTSPLSPPSPHASFPPEVRWHGIALPNEFTVRVLHDCITL